jgi:hypothetical protein
MKLKRELRRKEREKPRQERKKRNRSGLRRMELKKEIAEMKTRTDGVGKEKNEEEKSTK